MMSFVNIVTPDNIPWAAQFARELVSRLSYARMTRHPDSRALINYYLPYCTWKTRIGQIEAGLFGYNLSGARDNIRFLAIARQMNCCICLPGPDEKRLADAGIGNVVSLAPGIDHTLFTPRLRIGVVGRTYHTGRKGEALVAALQDIDWIEWLFTGEGWPGPALNLPDEEMPDFYRGLDYVLVPAYYEGGPMCVAEAIACGTEVIAPPVGWVPDFPHIEYRTGDEADLRRILSELYEKKRRIADNIASLTWDAWADGHDRVFNALAAKRGNAFSHAGDQAFPQIVKIVLATHTDGYYDRGISGNMAGILATLLEKATFYEPIPRRQDDPWPVDATIAHIFNSGDLHSCKSCVISAFRNRQPVVLSMGIPELGDNGFFAKLQTLFTYALADKRLDAQLKLLAQSGETSCNHEYKELFPGQFDTIRSITTVVIFYSYLFYNDIF